MLILIIDPVLLIIVIIWLCLGIILIDKYLEWILLICLSTVFIKLRIFNCCIYIKVFVIPQHLGICCYLSSKVYCKRNSHSLIPFAVGFSVDLYRCFCCFFNTRLESSLCIIFAACLLHFFKVIEAYSFIVIHNFYIHADSLCNF